MCIAQAPYGTYIMGMARKPSGHKRTRGRPFTYYSDRVVKSLMDSKQLNAGTIMDISTHLGISRSLCYEWMRDHPEFLDAVNDARARADESVESALLKRAKGFEYEEITVTTKDAGDSTEVTEKIATKQVAPDTGAASMWLKNRKPKEWRDQSNVQVEVTSHGDLLDKFFKERMAREAAAKESE